MTDKELESAIMSRLAGVGPIDEWHLIGHLAVEFPYLGIQRLCNGLMDETPSKRAVVVQWFKRGELVVGLRDD